MNYHIYILFRPFTQYFVEASLAVIISSSLHGYDTTSLAHLHLGNFSLSSLQILSSSIRLDGERWCAALFRSLQSCSIGFKSGLWLGHSRIFTDLTWSYSCIVLAVCLGSFSCWNGKPSLTVWVSWELWSRFPSRISLVLCCFHLSFDPDRSLSSCHWKTSPQHDAATTMLHCRDGIGQMMSSAWFPLGMMLGIQAKAFNLGFTRPENLVFHGLGIL